MWAGVWHLVGFSWHYTAICWLDDVGWRWGLMILCRTQHSAWPLTTTVSCVSTGVWWGDVLAHTDDERRLERDGESSGCEDRLTGELDWWLATGSRRLCWPGGELSCARRATPAQGSTRGGATAQHTHSSLVEQPTFNTRYDMMTLVAPMTMWVTRMEPWWWAGVRDDKCW